MSLSLSFKKANLALFSNFRHFSVNSSAQAKSVYGEFKTTNGVKVKIDYRSDTVSKPTNGMREAMAIAPCGDDVYGEDPTCTSLQKRVAKLVGHDDCLYMPTTTLSNQLGIRSHLTQPPYSVICDHRAHVFRYEAGATSYHTGATVYPVIPNYAKGETFMTAKEIEKNLILGEDIHESPTKLICIENTLNGTIMPIEYMRDIRALADEHGIKIHLDGARIWNAHVETKIPLDEYGSLVDSMTLCFSKGLGAPIGSCLTGESNFIKRANHFRKMFGGGWRQAGLLAAACHWSLDNILPRLRVDHENARLLASELSNLGFEIVHNVDTNMVWSKAPKNVDWAGLQNHLYKNGILVTGSSEARWVIYHWITRDHIIETINTIKNSGFLSLNNNASLNSSNLSNKIIQNKVSKSSDSVKPNNAQQQQQQQQQATA